MNLTLKRTIRRSVNCELLWYGNIVGLTVWKNIQTLFSFGNGCFNDKKKNEDILMNFHDKLHPFNSLLLLLTIQFNKLTDLYCTEHINSKIFQPWHLLINQFHIIHSKSVILYWECGIRNSSFFFAITHERADIKFRLLDLSGWVRHACHAIHFSKHQGNSTYLRTQNPKFCCNVWRQ